MAALSQRLLEIGLKCSELILSITLLILTEFGAGYGLAVDPDAMDRQTLGSLGYLPWGSTPSQDRMGYFVVSGYVFVLLVLALGSLVEDHAWMSSLIFTAIGSVLFLTIGVNQFVVWSDPGHRITYRTLYGDSQPWNSSPMPMYQASLAVVLSGIMLTDSLFVGIQRVAVVLRQRRSASRAPAPQPGQPSPPKELQP